MVERYSKTVAAIFLACAASSAIAQTSHCMSVGNNMVQCTSPNGAVTNCVQTGSNMAQCTEVLSPNAAPQATYPDGGAALGQGLADFVRGIGERKFRKKIGEMLAKGECKEAADYALTKGKIELGLQLQEYCAARAAPTVQLTADQMASNMARQAKVGLEIYDGWVVNEVSSVGAVLLITISQNKRGAPISEEQFAQLQEQSCIADLEPFFRQGGVISNEFKTLNGASLDVRLVDAEFCNLR